MSVTVKSLVRKQIEIKAEIERLINEHKRLDAQISKLLGGPDAQMPDDDELLGLMLRAGLGFGR